MKELTKLPDYDSIKAEYDFEAADVMVNGFKHAIANGYQGQMYNTYKYQVYDKWGFHPFNDIKLDNVQKMKIMISYGEKDPFSPETHGEYMAKFYSEKCNKDGEMFKNVEPTAVVGNDMGGKCLVNYGPPPKGSTGHEAHFIAFFKGELMRKFLDLSSGPEVNKVLNEQLPE